MIYNFSEDKIFCGSANHPNMSDAKNVFTTKGQVILSGRSGCGKSSFIAALTTDYPVIYLDLHSQKSILAKLKEKLPTWNDNYFKSKRLKDSDFICEQIALFNYTQKILECYGIACILYIIRRLNQGQTNYFSILLEQMNGSKQIIEDAALSLLKIEIDSKSIFKIITEYFESIVDCINETKNLILSSNLIFAIDECQAFKTEFHCILSYSIIKDPSAFENCSLAKTRFTLLFIFYLFAFVC